MESTTRFARTHKDSPGIPTRTHTHAHHICARALRHVVCDSHIGKHAVHALSLRHARPCLQVALLRAELRAARMKVSHACHAIAFTR